MMKPSYHPSIKKGRESIIILLLLLIIIIIIIIIINYISDQF